MMNCDTEKSRELDCDMYGLCFTENPVTQLLFSSVIVYQIYRSNLEQVLLREKQAGYGVRQTGTVLRKTSEMFANNEYPKIPESFDTLSSQI